MSSRQRVLARTVPLPPRMRKPKASLIDQGIFLSEKALPSQILSPETNKELKFRYLVAILTRRVAIVNGYKSRPNGIVEIDEKW